MGLFDIYLPVSVQIPNFFFVWVLEREVIDLRIGVPRAWCLYHHLRVDVYIYKYTSIETEKERERERKAGGGMQQTQR